MCIRDRSYINSAPSRTAMSEPVKLSRDCEAVQIPLGNTVTLPAGSAVDVVQTLGGNYTVHTAEGLFRIAALDADALGIEPVSYTHLDVYKRQVMPTPPILWPRLVITP